MNETKRYSIIISKRPGIGKWFRLLVFVAVMTFAPISIGILVGSTAMQWLGFLLSIWIIIALTNKQSFWAPSTDEVRAYLDKIDRGEA